MPGSGQSTARLWKSLGLSLVSAVACVDVATGSAQTPARGLRDAATDPAVGSSAAGLAAAGGTATGAAATGSGMLLTRSEADLCESGRLLVRLELWRLSHGGTVSGCCCCCIRALAGGAELDSSSPNDARDRFGGSAGGAIGIVAIESVIDPRTIGCVWDPVGVRDRRRSLDVSESGLRWVGGGVLGGVGDIATEPRGTKRRVDAAGRCLIGDVAEPS